MTSHLLNKSAINFESAGFLHEKSFFSSAAHCCYYACYQKFKHIWLHKIEKSELELERLSRNDKVSGSHEVLINQIISHIKQSSNSNNYNDLRVIQNNIPLLKKLRVKADYKDECFNFTDSAKSITLAQIIIPLLTKHQ